jgi:hypothetical protein
MRLLYAGNTLAVIPPFFVGLVNRHSDLYQIVLDHKQQGCVDLADVGEVGEHHERHEFELLSVRVLIVARLIVHDPRRQVVVVYDE